LTTVERAKENASSAGRTWQILFIVLLGAGIALTEYIFAYRSPTLGIGISLALVLLVYFLLSILRLEDRIAMSADSLVLVPVYILFTSSLPWFFLQQQYLLPAVYACVLVISFWHIYRHNLDFGAILNFNRRKLLKYTLIGLAIGIPLGAIEYLILHPSPTSPIFKVQYLFRDIIYMLVFVGFGEELLFRGLIQADLSKAFGWKWGLFATSLLFAVMHMTWRSVPELFFVFAAALILGGIYLRTRSLVAPIILHAANNVILVGVMPYLWPK
jgi:membrane protease YdiL (CAAX protease family)